MKRLFFLLPVVVVVTITSCKKSFLEVPTPNVITFEALGNKAGVEKLITAAYHDLTGLTQKSSWWSTSGTNWIYGDITSGDAYRGGTNDGSDGVLVEHFQATANTGFMADKWRTVYDGIFKTNSAIAAADTAVDMSAAEKAVAIAEARFLRAHFHFEAKKMWNNVPFIDKVATEYKAGNTMDIWPMIDADFRYAFNNLPEVRPLKGQANKWAAACYLAKSYMFQHRLPEARALLDSIIPSSYGGSGNGMNAQGVPYALVENFDDNFNGATENNAEQVFQIQFSVNDGSNGYNENIGESANTPAFYPLSSFYTSWKQPSFNLVNAFKTDENGLPMLDTFNLTNVTNDMSFTGYDFTYETYQGTVDPRLDWTVGRRGVPYLDWTDELYTYGYPAFPGSDASVAWINDRNFGGPYSPVKNNYRASQIGVYSDNYAQGYLVGSGVNYSIIRFADVLLWAAECAADAGDLEKAREYINHVRERAKTGRTVPVVYTEYSAYAASANYFVDTYNNSFPDKDFAVKAVRFERRLELALEGHRFFDLVRWGIADEYINNYLTVEKDRLPNNLSGVSFTKGKNEYFPVPQIEKDLNPDIVQNPGY